jgi:hypothetical protein
MYKIKYKIYSTDALMDKNTRGDIPICFLSAGEMVPQEYPIFECKICHCKGKEAYSVIDEVLWRKVSKWHIDYDDQLVAIVSERGGNTSFKNCKEGLKFICPRCMRIWKYKKIKELELDNEADAKKHFQAIASAAEL